MERTLLVKQAEFHRSVSAGFNSLLSDGALVDVSLGVEGRIVNAHKIVLALNSPYFRRMFETVHHPHPIIILKDVTMHHLSQVLNFIYHGEVHLPHSDIHDFLRIGKLLEVRGLINVEYNDCVTQQGRFDADASVSGVNQEVRPSPCKVYVNSRQPCTEDLPQAQTSVHEPDPGPAEVHTRIIADASSPGSWNPGDPIDPLILVPKVESLDEELYDFPSVEEEELEEAGNSDPLASTLKATDTVQPRRLSSEGSSSLLTAPTGSGVGGCCSPQANGGTFHESTAPVFKKPQYNLDKVLVVEMVDIFKSNRRTRRSPDQSEQSGKGRNLRSSSRATEISNNKRKGCALRQCSVGKQVRKSGRLH